MISTKALDAKKRNEFLTNIGERIDFCNKLIRQLRIMEEDKSEDIKFEKNTLTGLNFEFNYFDRWANNGCPGRCCLSSLQRKYSKRKEDKTVNFQM